MQATAANSDPVGQLIHALEASRLPPPSQRALIRKRAGVTLREMAAVLEVDPMTVHRWENGAEPRRDHAMAYRDLLDRLEAIT